MGYLDEENDDEAPALDLKELERKSAEAQDTKNMYGTLGSIASGFENVPSAYALLTGRGQGGGGTSSRIFKTLSDNIQDPWEKQKKTYENYLLAKNARKADVDLETKQAEQDIDSDSRDPESQVSKNARAVYGGVLAKIGLNPDALARMSKADIEDVKNNAVKIDDINQHHLDNQARIAAMADRAKAVGAQRAELKQTARDNKKNDEQDKYFSQISKELQTFRGNKVAQQAAADVYSAKKTLAMVKDKDPNKLSTQDLHLLAEELGKIATGGIPTESGVHALMPDTMKTRAAQFKQFLTNKPSDTQAAEFIKHNIDYLNEMAEVAESSLNDYRKGIYLGGKPRLRQEQIDTLNAQYHLDDEPKAHGAASLSPHGNTVPQTNHAGAARALPVKKEFNPKLNKTRITLSDGSVQIVDGRQ